jgi:hypothetical protein
MVFSAVKLNDFCLLRNVVAHLVFGDPGLKKYLS